MPPHCSSISWRTVMPGGTTLTPGCLTRPDTGGGDQHALEEAVGGGVEIVPILEGAGLALVAVDRHQARAGLAAPRAPLARGRKAGAAEAAQAGLLDGRQHVVDRQRARA